MYVLMFMFAVSMCFVFALLLVCVMVPTWLGGKQRRRQQIEFNQRFDRLRDDLTENSDFSQGFLANDIEAREQNLFLRRERLRLRREEHRRAEDQRRQLQELLALLESDIEINEETLLGLI